MVELGEAGGHLAAARPWRRDHNQGTGGFDVIVFPVAVFADNQRDIGRIAFNGVVKVYFNVFLFQLCLELLRAVLPLVMGDNHAAHIQSSALELVAQAQHIDVIGNPQVAVYLILFDIHCADDDDDFGAVRQLHQHLQLRVGSEAGQYPGSVIVVEELSAEFQIELVPKLDNTLLDVFRLRFQVFVIVKTNFHFQPRFRSYTHVPKHSPTLNL